MQPNTEMELEKKDLRFAPVQWDYTAASSEGVHCHSFSLSELQSRFKGNNKKQLPERISAEYLQNMRRGGGGGEIKDIVAARC